MGGVFAAAAFLAAPPVAAAEDGLTLLEALRLTLEHNFDIAIAQSAVGGARGALLGAEGRFDSLVTSDVVGGNERSPLTPGEVEFFGGSVGVQTELRSGLRVGSAVDLAQADLPGELATNDATLSFTVRQPLLRDRGRKVVTAGVRSLRRELEASAMSLRSTVEQELFVAGSLYWSWRAASLGLQILRGSESRSEERLATTRRLVGADVTPAADLVFLQADLASKRSSRIRGEREEFAARQELGLAIGLAEAEIRRLPPPSDLFPEVPAHLVDPGAEERLIALAVSARSDLEASRRRLDASRIRVVAAENSLRPRLDLLLVPSYTGRVAGEGVGGLLRPFYEDLHGFSTSVGFVVSWPTANRSARGDLAEAHAFEQQVRLRLDQLEHRVGGDVATALDGLRRNLELLEEARRAADLFEQAVENEEKKLLAGRSTLIDVISQQDRLTASRQVVLSAQLSVALSVLELRFETGSLLAWGEGEGAVAGDVAAARLERERLLSVPAAPGSVPAPAAEPGQGAVR